jgi:hypothetical protein
MAMQHHSAPRIELTAQRGTQRLHVHGILWDDPFEYMALEGSPGVPVTLVGTDAEIIDHRVFFTQVAQRLGYTTTARASAVLSYIGRPGNNADVFIVPGRWGPASRDMDIPALLDMRGHRDRMLGEGMMRVFSILGREAGAALYRIAFGGAKEHFVGVTQLEYAAHSFAHSIDSGWGSSTFRTSMNGAQARAIEELRADALSTLLVNEAAGDEVAVAVLAAQVVMRLACDYHNPSYRIETRAHRIAAELSLAELQRLLPRTSPRDTDRAWHAALRTLVNMRKDAIPPH